MRVIMSAAGRAFLRDFFVTFAALAAGIWVAPNINQAKATAAAATIAGLVAGVRGLRVFVPQISEGLATLLRVPNAYAEVAITAVTTFLVGFIALSEAVLGAPDLNAAKAAAAAGLHRS